MLVDAKKVALDFPGIFDVPGDGIINALKSNDFVRICSENEKGMVERFWVIVKSLNGDVFEGIVDNDFVFGFNLGDKITFEKNNICGIFQEGVWGLCGPPSLKPKKSESIKKAERYIVDNYMIDLEEIDDYTAEKYDSFKIIEEDVMKDVIIIVFKVTGTIWTKQWRGLDMDYEETDSSVEKQVEVTIKGDNITSEVI